MSQQSEKSNPKRCSCDTSKSLVDSLPSHIIGRPLIILLDNLIFGICFHWGARVLFLSIQLHCIEVVVLCLFPIWQVPENSNVFKAQVVPLIVVWVVWYRVLVNILSFKPAASQSNELSFVDLIWSTSLVSVLSRDPASVHNNGRTIKFYWVVLQCNQVEHRQFTSFIAINWINDIKPCLSILYSWNQNFFAVIKLSNQVIGPESMIYNPLLIWHSPPGEIELLPWSAVNNLSFEFVSTLSTKEILFDVLSIGQITDCTCKACTIESSILKEAFFFLRQSLDESTSQHIILTII